MRGIERQVNHEFLLGLNAPKIVGIVTTTTVIATTSWSRLAHRAMVRDVPLPAVWSRLDHGAAGYQGLKELSATNAKMRDSLHESLMPRKHADTNEIWVLKMFT